MLWWNVVKRAWADTLGGLGISHFSPLRLLLWAPVSTAFVILIWWWRGETEAMTEASEIVLYALAFVGVAVFPLFLWNLWLAPYWLINEKFGQLQNQRNKGGGLQGRISGTASLGLHPGHFNVKHWEGVKAFKLGEAACLWANIRPHSPIEDDRAAGKFAQLSSAMMRGEIPYTPGGLRALTNFLEGKRPWPEYSQPVSAISLRKYANGTNDVPPFLQSVEVPPDPGPVEEKEDE